MSSVGKIFIILNLLLAAAFLGWASSAVSNSQKWMSEHTALKATTDAEREDLNAQIDTLTADKGQIEQSRVQQRELANQLQARADNLETQLAEAKAMNAQLRGDVTAIQETLNGYKDTIDQLEANKDRAVDESRQRERERDEAVAAKLAAEEAQRAAEETLAGAEQMIAQLETDLTSTRGDLSQRSTELSTLMDITNTTLDQVTSQVLVEGSVVEVRNDVPPGLLALNVGADDGVVRGMTFEIFNGNQYKGQARVQSVLADKCSALIIRTVEGRSVQQGDRASTRL